MDHTQIRTDSRLYLGDHLKVARLGYSHHGIYCGQGMVIAKTRDGVHEYTLSEFADGAEIKTVAPQGDLPFSRGEIVSRARSRLGEKHYNLLTDNCEHFANWCTYGVDNSPQVKKAGAIAAGGIAAVTLTAGLALRHINKGRILNAAATAATVHPAGGLLKAAVIAAKTAQTLSTANDARKIITQEVSGVEKGIALAGVVAGLSPDEALTVAGKTCALGSETIERSKEQARKAVELSAMLLSDVKSNVKAKGGKIISHLPQRHSTHHHDN